MKLKGKSVYAGIAIGPIVVICKEELQVKRERIQSTGNEIERLGKAIEKAKEELEGLYQIALKEVGEENAMIFQIHQLMLEDADFIDTAIHAIKTEMINAEYALARACDLMCHMFESMEDEYMKGRAADVRDISNRVIRILQQSAQQVSLGKEPAIIFAEDLSPSETIQLDKTKILAFVTRFGTTTSHTAILARTMNIPAVKIGRAHV